MYTEEQLKAIRKFEEKLDALHKSTNDNHKIVYQSMIDKLIIHGWVYSLNNGKHKIEQMM